MSQRFMIVPFLLLAAGLPISADLRDTLKQPIDDYRFEGTVGEIVRTLQERSGVEIAIDWDELTAAGVKSEQRLRLSGPSRPLATVLDLLSARLGQNARPVTWVLRGQRVVLTSQAAALGHPLTGKPPTDARPPDDARPRRSTRPERAVQPPAEFHFRQTPLGDVVAFFRQATGVNFFVNWGALKQVDITRSTPVSFRAKSISFAQALDLTMKELNGSRGRLEKVYWVIDDGVVNISTGADLDTQMRTRVIEIGSLLGVQPDFRAPRMNLSAVGTGESSNGSDQQGQDFGELFEEDEEQDESTAELSPAELRQKRRTTLVDIVKNSIGRDMWHPNGRGTIEIYRDRMIITQSLLGFKLMEQAGR